MNTDDLKNETPADAKPVLVVGHLEKGQHFQIRKNGKWYTVHAQVIEQMNDGDSNTGRGDFFTIAVSNGRMYAFHFLDKVIVPCH